MELAVKLLLTFGLVMLHAVSTLAATVKPGICPTTGTVLTCSKVTGTKCKAGDDSACPGKQKCCLVSKLCGNYCRDTVVPVSIPPPMPTQVVPDSPSSGVHPCAAKKCYGCRAIKGIAYCGCTDKNYTKYHHSQMFTAADGCNTCWCKNGTIVCTKQRCQGCAYNGQKYSPSFVFNSTDGCNTCQCRNGTAVCTKRACAGCPYNGKKYSHNTTFSSIDGCNKCWCKNGTVGCTKKACGTGTPPLTCKDITCLKGQRCVLMLVHCIRSPCPSIPTCVPGTASTVATPTGGQNACSIKYAAGVCMRDLPCTVIGGIGYCGCRGSDGNSYRHMSKIPSPGVCDSCFCYDGALACSTSNCITPVPGVCRDNAGKTRAVGTVWSPNNCTKCRCQTSLYGPVTYCVKPSCDYCPGGRRVAGQCCPICPTKQPPTVSSTATPTNFTLCQKLRLFVRIVRDGINVGSSTSWATPGNVRGGRRRRSFFSESPTQPSAIVSGGVNMQGGSSTSVLSGSNFLVDLRNFSKVFPSFPIAGQMADNNDSVVLYVPTCSADGSFQTEQCVPMNSGLKCFCINPVTGDPYAVRKQQSGTAFLQRCPAAPMPSTCELQRSIGLSRILGVFGGNQRPVNGAGSPQRVGRATKDDDSVPTPLVGSAIPPIMSDNVTSSTSLGVFIPVCNKDGSFASTQCDAWYSSCWCVDPTTGTELRRTRRQHPLQPKCGKPVGPTSIVSGRPNCRPCYLPCPLGLMSVGTNCTRCRCVQASKPTAKPTCLSIHCGQRCHLGQIAQGNNCTGCQCVRDTSGPTCSPIACQLYCPLGFQQDQTGCPLCRCVAAPTPTPCAIPGCVNSCPSGRVMTGDGCSTCTCRQSSAPCDFSLIYTCFRINGQISLTLNLTCKAASTAIKCFNQYVSSGRIAGCDASEKQKLGKKLSEAKKMQLDTCQKTQCSYGGKSYQNGDSFPASDGCNSCVCSSGIVGCTKIGCESTTMCVYNSTRYSSRSTFDALDGCNTCTCSEGTVACTERACDQTRYLRTTLRFNADYNTVISNEQKRREFTNTFRNEIARRLFISPAQVTIIDVRSGSIVVEFAVQAANLETVEEQLDDSISSQSFQLEFNGMMLIPDNTEVTYQKQVGSLTGGDSRNGDDGDGSNTALIVGIVCGVVAAIVLTVVIIVLIIRFAKPKSKDNEPTGYSNGIYSSSTDSAQISLTSKPFDDSPPE